MKPFFTSLALLFISSLLFAVDETILQQLKIVNTNWNNIPVFNSQLLEQRQIQSEKELIQTHLKFTIQYLESSKQILSVEQKQNRNACINKLKQYQAQGVFPVNTHHLCRQPYFIDDFNNYCAVGYLLKETGFDNVARQIHNEMNYAYVKEIPETYITGWANKFGFAIDELALIQPTYSTYLRCRNDTFFVGKNTATICPIFQNDLYHRGACNGLNGGITFTFLDSALHGTVSVAFLPTDTFLIYQPDSNFVGTDSLRYKAIYSLGCDYTPDTAIAVFNVLPNSGNYVSFKQCDGNYDGQIDNMDFLFLAKNMGEHGSARTFNNVDCATTYNTPWNASYMSYNAASCDADGNGVVNEVDFDLAQECIQDTLKYFPQSYTSTYSLVFSSYDTLLTAGDRVNVQFVVKDSNGLGNIVPLKALAMNFKQTNVRINLLTTEPTIHLPNPDASTIDKHYCKKVVDIILRTGISSGCMAIEGNSLQNQTCVASDSFSITGNSIISDSIHSNGLFALDFIKVIALDLNDNIIYLRQGSLLFMASKSVTDIDDIAPTSFSLHPNPATTSVTITTTDEMIGSTITVTDITGRVLPSTAGEGARRADEVAVLLSTDFPNGIYLLTLTAPNGKSATKKLVISK